MKKQLLAAGMLCTLGLVGCGGSTTTPPGNTDTGPKYNTADKISTYLEGKTLEMSGANIPDYPNGFNEDVNYGSATQCYTSVTMAVAGGNYNVTSNLGTLRDTSTKGVQECDHATKSNQTSFTSTNVLIENVRADGTCFDVTFTYTGFKQVGRGQVSQDGKTLKLELFFENQATGSRCADGDVGAQTVTLNKVAFTHNAVQTYTIQ